MKILFRFRDLIAPTLEEHRRIIETAGSCWWGWWKRPSEGPRQNVWADLKSQTASGLVAIGLFDSGTGKVWEAKVSDVILPNDDDLVPPLLDEEGKLVPEYYRASPFSRAWIRIAQLADKPVPHFFGAYAYREPPPLPRVSESHLGRLRGKRIVDREELAAMDTTIWEIERAGPNAASDHFLAPSSAVSMPISTDPIPLKSNRILHLTDLHFDARGSGGRHVWSRSGHRPLSEMIGQAIAPGKIGGIVITGDFTMVADAAEFEEAKRAVAALMGIFDLGPSEILFCPGNHDIQWTKDPSELYDATNDIHVQAAPAAAKANYAKLYRELLRHEPHEELSMGRRWVLPNGCVVEVCGLNSASLETGKRYLAGLGRLAPAAFGTAASSLGWSRENSLALRVIAVHHHVTQTESSEDPSGYYLGFGMLADAKKLLREAAASGVQLVLHGHKHRAFLWREGVYHLPEHAEAKRFLGNVAVLGGGSAGSTETDGGKNYFQILSVEPDKLKVNCFKSENGGPFREFTEWAAALTIAEGRLSVGEWK
jgi:hypothetical protein